VYQLCGTIWGVFGWWNDQSLGRSAVSIVSHENDRLFGITLSARIPKGYEPSQN
jgi:hypothetical protein